MRRTLYVTAVLILLTSSRSAEPADSTTAARRAFAVCWTGFIEYKGITTPSARNPKACYAQ